MANRIYRVQHRGHVHKFVPERADSHPSSEKVHKTKQALQQPSGVALPALHVMLRAERRIDLKRPSAQEVGHVLSVLDIYNNPNPQKKRYETNELKDLVVTYFGSRVLCAALAKKNENFGVDIAQTRDTVEKFKANFGMFLGQSRRIQTMREDYQDPRDELFGAVERPNPLMQMWGSANAVIHPTLKVFKKGYLVFDLSHNDFMNREYEDIRDYFVHTERLDIPRPSYDNGPGEKPFMLHATAAVVSPYYLRQQPPVLIRPPGLLPLHPPELIGTVKPFVRR